MSIYTSIPSNSVIFHIVLKQAVQCAQRKPILHNLLKEIKTDYFVHFTLIALYSARCFNTILDISKHKLPCLWIMPDVEERDCFVTGYHNFVSFATKL